MTMEYLLGNIKKLPKNIPDKSKMIKSCIYFSIAVVWSILIVGTYNFLV